MPRCTALLSWPFDASSATRVSCPVSHVAGSHHGPFSDAVGDLIRAWLPHTEQVVVAGAGHAIAMPHPDPLLEVLVPFLARHPVG